MSCPVQEVWRYAYPLKVESLVIPQLCSLHISTCGVLFIADMRGRLFNRVPLPTLKLLTHATSPACVKDMQNWFLSGSLPVIIALHVSNVHNLPGTKHSAFLECARHLDVRPSGRAGRLLLCSLPDAPGVPQHASGLPHMCDCHCAGHQPRQTERAHKCLS